MLADAHLVVGNLDATEEIVTEVKPHVTFGDGVMSAVLRIEAQADIIRHQAKAARAEGLLLSALQITRQQHYRAYELRTVLALARLWKLRGQREQAANLLEPVYQWFSEGFDMPDLQDAKALLDELRRVT